MKHRQKTFFAVVSFHHHGRGRPIINEHAASSGTQAVRMAERLSREKGGALAFSRTGDPTTGDYDDAVILGCFGEVPKEALMA